MSTTTSRALRFHRTGEPLDVLREDRVEVPDPPADGIRVRTLAAGLNPADWELCRGFLPGSLPRGIGYDVAGEVDAVGSSVDPARARPGDLVLGSADLFRQASAGAADVVVLDHWAPVPTGLDPVRAAVMPMVVQTAAWTLQVMEVRAGETLLVHGAGGMVGYAAVQMALARGVRVIATAGPTFRGALETFGAQVTSYGAISNHDEARALGARVNLDLRSPDLTPLDELLTRFGELAARDAFDVPIGVVHPFANWRDAVARSVDEAPHGKVVLHVGGTTGH